jgi:hypothetical protein
MTEPLTDERLREAMEQIREDAGDMIDVDDNGKPCIGVTAGLYANLGMVETALAELALARLEISEWRNKWAKHMKAEAELAELRSERMLCERVIAQLSGDKADLQDELAELRKWQSVVDFFQATTDGTPRHLYFHGDSWTAEIRQFHNAKNHWAQGFASTAQEAIAQLTPPAKETGHE